MEQYQVKNTVHPLLGWGTPVSDYIVHTNYNYYGIEEIPPLIDEQYLDNYYLFLEFVLTKYRDIVKPLMKLYDEGKITTSHKDDNYFNQLTNRLKNNKLVSILILVVLAATAILTFINQGKDTTDRFFDNKKERIISDTTESTGKSGVNKQDTVNKTKVDTTRVR